MNVKSYVMLRRSQWRYTCDAVATIAHLLKSNALNFVVLKIFELTLSECDIISYFTQILPSLTREPNYLAYQIASVAKNLALIIADRHPTPCASSKGMVSYLAHLQ